MRELLTQVPTFIWTLATVLCAILFLRIRQIRRLERQESEGLHASLVGLTERNERRDDIALRIFNVLERTIKKLGDPLINISRLPNDGAFHTIVVWKEKSLTSPDEIDRDKLGDIIARVKVSANPNISMRVLLSKKNSREYFVSEGGLDILIVALCKVVKESALIVA